MSILIKGMEMPTSCGTCPIRHMVFHVGDECYLGAKITEYQRRPEDCPLGYVPPHGRLIDADAFAMGVINSFMDCADLFDDANSLAKAAEITDAFVRDINEAPTIIPADKGGEG